MKENRKKIILVDDINYCLVTVRNGLEKDYDVYPASSVDDMFDMLGYVVPDLILLDIYMPGADGYEGIKRLKADERYADIPVIFLTSERDKEILVKGLALGGADYVSKPVSIPLLTQRIEYHLNPETRKKSLRVESARRKIIYVDDVNYILISAKSRLEKHYEIYPAQSVYKMFDILENVIPDLILLDVNMPNVDGYQAIEWLKTDVRYRRIPVIFLTSKSDKESVTKGLSLGAAAYITKPFTDSMLIEHIENILRPEMPWESKKF
ncbi:MAG: response regulator [Chitinivibrionia bacterium]|nr:response regulator [Chitinivibrionia bacterium]